MPTIILYGYPESPYYQKLITTLNFLGLPYSICFQPRVLPRNDFQSVGINYRRIPLLSIDGHMYADTSLIISKLCSLAKVPNHRETETLGATMFPWCAQLIPVALMNDEAFLKDRGQLTGTPWSKENIAKQRPFALSQFLSYVSVIESMIKNGNGFIRDGKVTMADLHLVFVVSWVLFAHKGAEPEVSPSTHPTLYKWAKTVLETAGRKKVDKVKFEEAKRQLQSAEPASGKHDASEPLGFKVGSAITVTPMDTGKTHPQPGSLEFINNDEVCVKTSGGVLISFPRLGYIIRPSKSGKL